MKKNSLIFVLAGILFVLAMALMSQTKKPAAPAGTGGLQASMDRGKEVYLKQCLACHQADAGGVPNMNPPLIGTKQVLGDKTALVLIVLNGLKGNIEVEGDTYHNVMAPHSELTDLQIADVLTYVRNSFGNKAKAVTPAEVKAIRAKNVAPAGK
jgi:mono/diheme cytochrome c family protein